MRVQYNPDFGKASLYDARSLINTHNFKPDFNKLTLVKDWHLRQHNMSIKYQDKKYRKVALLSKYPDIKPSLNYVAIEKLLDAFLYLGSCEPPQDETILVEFQRITCSREVVGLPENNDWTCHDNITKIGILCVERDNVRGGIHEIKNDRDQVLKTELSPGFFFIFDGNIQGRDTPMTPFFQSEDGFEGHRDLIILKRLSNDQKPATPPLQL